MSKDIDISASVQLVWQIANQEAVTGHFQEIEPEHFLMAALKFAEISEEEIYRMAPGAEVATQIIADARAIREILTALSLSSSSLRRQLRQKMGNGASPYGGDQLHRSLSSKALFIAASKRAEDAKSDMLTVEHLLDALLASQIPLIEQALTDAAGKRQSQQATPLLERYGQDVARMTEREILTARQQQAVSKALIHTLSLAQQKCILLIYETREAAMPVIISTARMLGRAESPRNLRHKRVLDITSIRTLSSMSENKEDLLGMLFLEAQSSHDVILVFSPEANSDQDNVGAPWLSRLKQTLEQTPSQCICPISRITYQEKLEKDLTWKSRAQIIWLNEDLRAEIPWEL